MHFTKTFVAAVVALGSAIVPGAIAHDGPVDCGLVNVMAADLLS